MGRRVAETSRELYNQRSYLFETKPRKNLTVKDVYDKVYKQRKPSYDQDRLAERPQPKGLYTRVMSHRQLPTVDHELTAQPSKATLQSDGAPLNPKFMSRRASNDDIADVYTDQPARMPCLGRKKPKAY